MPDQGAFDPHRGWALVKSSVEVLRGNRILLVYPIAGLLYTVSFTALFIGAIFWARAGYWSLWLGIYLPMMFGFTFTNVAFNHELMKAFSGDRVSLRRGFAFALRRIKAILFWSVFAGLVGMLIEKLSERFGVIGRLIFGVTGGTIWSVASVFVIPIMIREESSNPFKLLRESSGLIKRTWRGLVVGFVGFGLEWLLTLASMALLTLVVCGYIALSIAVPSLDIGDIALCFCLIGGILVAYLPVLTFSSIFSCALYIYASEGVVPEPYNPELMDGAWKVK